MYHVISHAVYVLKPHLRHRAVETLVLRPCIIRRRYRLTRKSKYIAERGGEREAADASSGVFVGLRSTRSFVEHHLITTAATAVYMSFCVKKFLQNSPPPILPVGPEVLLSIILRLITYFYTSILVPVDSLPRFHILLYVPGTQYIRVSLLL